MKVKKWIFVTGAPRSATTFVGKILSLPVSVDYIHEPFNPDCGIPGIQQRFLYLRSGGKLEKKLRPLFESLFNYDFSLKTAYYPNDSGLKRLFKKMVGSRGPFYLRLAKMNPLHEAAVIKDPIGCLLTEYLYQVFGVKPVVIIRHPLSFTGSYLRLNWPAYLRFLQSQKELVEDYFSDEVAFSRSETSDPLAAAAMLWRALNKVLLIQAERNPDWCILTHEQLCSAPAECFRSVYERLGLKWSVRIEKRVLKLTSRKNRVEAKGGRIVDFKRDSRSIFELRKSRFSPQEKELVYSITRDVAERIYPPESFH